MLSQLSYAPSAAGNASAPAGGFVRIPLFVVSVKHFFKKMQIFVRRSYVINENNNAKKG